MTNKNRTKVGIDIRTLSKGEHTGVEEYTRNLLDNMMDVADREEVEFHLFYNAFRKQELSFDWLEKENVFLHEFSIPNRLVMFPLNSFLNIPKVDKLLGGVDVFFSPHIFLNSLSNNTKSVITTHDLSFLRYPEHFTFSSRLWHKLMQPKWQLKNADKVISVSFSTKKDLVDLYNIEEDKIEVIHSGIPEGFGPIEDNERLEEVRDKYDLPDKFILYLGTIEPRKNIGSLIRAFNKLQERNNFDDIHLVLAGAEGWKYEEVYKEIEKSPYKENILRPGFIEEKDKVVLYNLADYFVYPSFFEGFGFPPLEAMRCGVPTITSNRSSLPEVVGDSAIMIDPYRAYEITEALEELIEDRSLYSQLSEDSKQRAKQFSWDKTAQKTLDTLIKTS